MHNKVADTDNFTPNHVRDPLAHVGTTHVKKFSSIYMGNSHQQFLYQNKEWSPYIRHISTDKSLNVVLPSTESAEAERVTIEIVEPKTYGSKSSAIRFVRHGSDVLNFLEAEPVS